MNNLSRTALRVRHQARLRLVQVARVELVSPRMRRITLTGDELDGFASEAADDHVKLFFPAPGQDRPVLPMPGSGGLVFPVSAVPPAVRDYTVRRFLAGRNELTIEFVLHGDACASSWASEAKPGHWIGVGGPRSSLLTPDDFDTYLLVGDETALPAIARHLEEMRPGVRALALIEVADQHEERYLPSAANTAITWLRRDGVPAGRSTLLAEALRKLILPQGKTCAWLAGEIETVRRLRRYLLEEAGMFRAQVRAAGYWRLGGTGTPAKVDD